MTREEAKSELMQIYMSLSEEKKQALDVLMAIPSVEPKTGHWITQWNLAHQKEYYYCSECREEYSYDGETGIKMNDYKYCPNCGARMFELQESEEV